MMRIVLVLMLASQAFADKSRYRDRDLPDVQRLNYCTKTEECTMVEVLCEMLGLNKDEMPAFKELDKKFSHGCRSHQRCESVECLEHRCVPRDCGTMD